MQIYLIFFLEGHYFLDIQYKMCIHFSGSFKIFGALLSLRPIFFTMKEEYMEFYPIFFILALKNIAIFLTSSRQRHVNIRNSYKRNSVLGAQSSLCQILFVILKSLLPLYIYIYIYVCIQL